MIHFFTEEVEFQIKRKNEWKKWIQSVIRFHQFIPGDIQYVFCSDQYLLEVNKKYLNHDYFTDIITFPSDDYNKISGDLMISIDRVIDHAKERNISFMEELKRVMIHGVLHLIGFNDKTDLEEAEMRIKEDEAMRMFHVEQTREHEYFVSRETKLK